MWTRSDAPAPEKPIHFNGGGTVMVTHDMMVIATREGPPLPRAQEVTWTFVQPEEIAEDRRWECSFAISQDALVKFGGKALADFLAGKTEPLDPDRL